MHTSHCRAKNFLSTTTTIIIITSTSSLFSLPVSTVLSTNENFSTSFQLIKTITKRYLKQEKYSLMCTCKSGRNHLFVQQQQLTYSIVRLTTLDLSSIRLACYLPIHYEMQPHKCHPIPVRILSTAIQI